MGLNRTVSQTPIEINVADRLRWQGLLTQALDRRLCVTEIDAYPVDGRWREHKIQVSSYSMPGEYWHVYITVSTVPGVRTVRSYCRCKGASYNGMCTHQAIALEQASLWPRALVVSPAPGTLETDERYELWIGDWVQVIGTERRAVVDGTKVEQGRPVYKLTDPDLHESWGLFFGYELRPCPKPVYESRVDPAIGLALLTGGRAS